MNIRNISHHILFNSIFEQYTDKESGKINWAKLVKHPNLPVSFIDNYFLHLQCFKLEKYQDLDEFVVDKYAHKINWMLFVLNRKIPIKILDKHFNFLLRNKLLRTVLHYQILNFEFINQHIENFVSERENVFKWQRFTEDEAAKLQMRFDENI